MKTIHVSPLLSTGPFFLALLLTLGAPPAFSQETTDPWTVQPAQELDRRPGTGETCIVCNQSIHGDDVVELRYRGRTFYVAAKMLGDFENDPAAYFSQLQARTALFDEHAVIDRPMASGWLIFGLYVLLGLVCAAICGYLAISRALPPIPWFFAGLIGNLAAIFVLLATPRGDASALPSGILAGLNKVATTRTPLDCPNCGYPNHPAADQCSGCNAKLTPSIESETVRARALEST